ncbi:OB-fold putative lipoprotein [Lactococcus petauri]|uniref:OB-fold protein n=1 Tax=Lactococcus petauri TaxID=1940789 RepID=UPI002435BEDA|nr:hypothetical protein [Lactococcus petauri]MDG6136552.1 OB-fold putative lipoprotein [Lactococcus petauri]
MKKLGILGLLIISTTLLAGCSELGDQSQKSNNSSSETTQQSSSEAPEVKIVPVTFQQMVADYLANGVAADEKYKGKVLEFEGTIKSITANPLGGSNINIEAGNFTDNPFMKTNAVIAFSDENAKKLVSGQSYKFTAIGNGAVIMDNWVNTLNFQAN